MSTAAPARRVRIATGTLAGQHGTVVRTSTDPNGPCSVRLDSDPRAEPVSYWPHEIVDLVPNALLVANTGESLRLTLPADAGPLRAAAATHLGGPAVFNAHAVQCPHGAVLGLAVRVDSAALEVNDYAQIILDTLGGETRPELLRGPVLFAGPEGGDGRSTGLTGQQLGALERLLQILRRMLGAPAGT
ncbi:hypothetical protein [Kitasatospora cheerisanensis]|uniref:Uncharacterized protein n=1 Tax=Kitasatospora cheerisanensis KCTC 2395 TaxID=1348663 RepID=A0A066YW13_9ACTN|nr:hypothetical protein [Kitasatospora cheerisanensis]KDN85703.1 hypothetical protein KCH_25310 [Kitasatospora cheerisanensis KCTC 2395]